MVGVIAKALATLFIAFFALIGVVYAGRTAPSALDQAFDAGCEGVAFGMCFLGIKLGQTTIAEARDILANHSWVVSVTSHVFYDYFEVAHQHFVWRDPRVPDAPLWRGELIASEATIDSVRLESDVTLGELWGALGGPGVVAHQGQANNRLQSTLLSYLFFTDNTMVVSRADACPITYHSFLMGEVNALELRNTAFTVALEQHFEEVNNLGQLLRGVRSDNDTCS